MADATYSPQVYQKQGGAELVVANGGQINVEAGGKIVAAGTQAVVIAAISTTSGVLSAAERTKFNSVLTALTNVGILAAS